MKFKILLILCLLVCGSAYSDDMKYPSFDSQNLNIFIDIETQSAEIQIDGVINIEQGLNSFKLNKTAIIDSFLIDNSEFIFKSNFIDNDSAFFDVHFTSTNLTGEYPFRLIFTATFNDEVENVRFSNENVGREVAGTILEKGAYLSLNSYFFPQGKEESAMYSVTANIPGNWESVSDGNKKEQRVEGDRKIQKWENPYKSDGLMFMAAPYVIKDTVVNDINIACYFFEEDTSLFDGYLASTVGYMEMYSEMIGPYPYNSFIVAENFFPTGYGMPGWTLLGQQVIRLPFIKYTSLGHEVLHNWWGNSVYVDYNRGNWCEAAAVYGADYQYKLQRSESSAKSYRKDILKQYVSYVNEGNDFPIREFTSRTSADTRTIGYNKAMMVYHMIEEEIGSDAFWMTWKDIYNNYITKQISWEEWVEGFEKKSGIDLSHIIPQWINQAGAPLLSISDVQTMNENLSKRVTFKISESSGQKYSLQVPVRFSGADVPFDTTLSLSNNEQIYQLIVPKESDKIEIDPDFHLFRKLYPQEVEPIISGIIGYEKRAYVTNLTDSTVLDNYLQFGTNIEEELPVIEQIENVEFSEDKALVILNPESLPEYFNSKISIDSDSYTLLGQTFPKDGHTLVLSGDHFGKFEKHLIVVTSDYESLPRLGQLIPHYGKYSYLVFEGSRNMAKGQWDVDESPLKVGL